VTELYLPPEQRVELLREYAKRHGLRTFVETGTAEGFTLKRVLDDFDTLHTVEIDNELWSRAVDIFGDLDKNVMCWPGSSADVLPVILRGLTAAPALFWLDGHWCGKGHNPNGPDTPIREELPLVLGHKLPHVVLVDDARLFREGRDWESEQYDWPPLSWVRKMAESHGYRYDLADDVIRLVP
jgi:hypothetical protein